MQDLFSKIGELTPPDLVTRELGLQAYDLMRNALTETKPGDILILNFREIRVMDSSFAGGSILKLLREMANEKYGERYMVLAETSPSTEENIHLTIIGHDLKLVLQKLEGRNGYHLIGQIEPNLKDTLDIINKKGILTARELANMNPGMAINTASNRMKKLFDLHQIRRVEQITNEGRQHEYQSIIVK